jgi:PAS domain S-box-containing protein
MPLTLRGYWWTVAVLAGTAQVVTMGVVTAGILARSPELALIALLTGSVLVAAVLSVGTPTAVGRSVRMAQDLAAAAREIALSGHARIPHVDRSDEIGELARALQAWQRASTEREIMIQQAPIGICQLDRGGRVIATSPAFPRMLGLPPAQVEGRVFDTFLEAEDRARHRPLLSDLAAGRLDRVALEGRLVRAGGSLLWCSTIAAPVRDAEGRPEGFVAIVEDIGERREQLERAARIQRALLPRSAPHLEGYELAGTCRPAQDVAGDFYDWTLSDAGHLDVTVADVMGKGVGSGLVMATIRAVLRSAPAELGPAARIELASGFLNLGAGDDALFVTLFHGRLDLASGVIRYVDAGHGYAAVRRAGGELVRLAERSLPVGIWPEQEFTEGTTRLEPGDTLIVHSDGLVESGDRTGDLSDYAGDLAAAADAGEMVRRLMRHLPGQLQDDVTVLALRRAARPGSRAGPNGDDPLAARVLGDEVHERLPALPERVHPAHLHAQRTRRDLSPEVLQVTGLGRQEDRRDRDAVSERARVVHRSRGDEPSARPDRPRGL